MTYCIKVTNLPQDFEEKDAVEMFDDIGPIKRLYISRAQDPMTTSSAFIQFFSTRNARLAAINKDWTMFQGKEIRVRVIWCSRENLTTVKITNLPPTMGQKELMEYFASYGEIMNIRISQMPVAMAGDKKWKSTEIVALIAYTRVDYALRACQEMDQCVISNNTNGYGLSVTLLNGDARNLKWKKNRFEYVYCHFPIEKATGLTAYHSCLLNTSKSQANIKSSSKSPRLSSDCSSVSSCDSTDTTSKHLASKALLSDSGSDQSGSAASWQLSPSWSEQSTHSMTSSSCQNMTSMNTTSCDTLPMPELSLPPQSATAYVLPPLCNHVSPSFSNSLSQPSKMTTCNIQSNVLSSCPISSALLTSSSSCSGPFLSLVPSIQTSTSNQSCFILSTTMSQRGAVCPISCTPNVPLVISNTQTLLGAPPSLPQTTADSSSFKSHSILATLQLSQAQLSQSLNTNTNTCLNAQKLSSSVDSKVNTSVGKPLSASADGKKSNLAPPPTWTAEQRKIGDIIYQELKTEFPGKVAKLTGMLLTLPKHELNQLLCDKKKLKARANQFVLLL